MIPRKHPSLLSERQKRRKIGSQKKLFCKEVEEVLLELDKSYKLNVENVDTSVDAEDVDTNDNAKDENTKLPENTSQEENDDINFKCLLNQLCRDEQNTTTLANFETKVSGMEVENPDEAIQAILSQDDNSDFYDVMKEFLSTDDEEEVVDEDDETAIYLDFLDKMSEKNDKNLRVINDIRKLCTKYIHTIPHIFINELLVKLKKITGVPFPKDARTFLKTPRKSVTYRMGIGEYCHYGIESALESFHTEYKKKGLDPDSIKLIANIDGAALANSSEDGTWIITISETRLNLVELVGIYNGEHKPKDSDDLVQMFVDELIHFITNGVTFGDKKYNVEFHCLVCDSPAKSYILKLKLHSGYYSCTKCTIRGDYLNKVIFPTRCQANTKLRIDEEFMNQQYDPKNVLFDEFQQGETIMKTIPNFKPISDVVLDYMHLICLGVMIKLIELWIQNPKVVLSEYERQKISNMLVNFKEFIPSDFSRNPRQFKNVGRLWKAHELRTFLLYTGPVVLYKILPLHLYLHFLLLHVAISILVNPILCRVEANLKYAEDLLILFVKTFETYYGEENMVFNIHNLPHIVNDVRRFGSVDNFSAFRFENHIRKIKQLIRQGNKKLQQIANRLVEIRASKEIVDDEDVDENNFDLLRKNQHFQVLKKNSVKINCRNEKDKFVLLQTGMYIECCCFMKGDDGKIHVIGRPIKTIGCFYENPLDSSKLSINIIESTDNKKPLERYSYESLKAKVCRLPLDKIFVALPLIHTFDKF